MAESMHIVVMNDDTMFLSLMSELLTDEGYRVTLIRESRKAYELIKEIMPDLAVLDVRMGNELTGFELISLLVLDPATKSIPLIVASADSRALTEHQGQLAQHNIPVLHKPFDLDDLMKVIAEKLGPTEPADA